MKPKFRDLIIAILSALITYFTTSCSTVWIKGENNNPVIEHTPTIHADSTSFVSVATGRNV